MNNPLHILQTLDSHLTAPAEITIFGRAALALGYPNSPGTFATTNDVDAILQRKLEKLCSLDFHFKNVKERFKKLGL